jgi:hypothetical protein
MIRQHQEERYNKLFDENSKTAPKKSDDATNGFHKDFEEAQTFMQNLTEKTTLHPTIKNKSLKQYRSKTAFLSELIANAM